MFEHIAIFISLIECNSFSKASETLNLSQATISRKMAELEKYIGKILIARDTRNMKLTEDGVLLYSKFKDIRKDFDNYLLEINYTNRKTKSLKTILRICLHSTISDELICPYLKYYTKQFPDVQLDIIFYSVDLINDINFDIGISHRALENPEFVVKPIRNDSMKFFCSPQYVTQYGLPKTIDELKQHTLLGALDNSNNELQEIKLITLINKYTHEEIRYDISSSFIRTNSAAHSRKIGVSSDYIFGCWESLCENDVRQGKLIAVLPEWNISKDNTFYLIYKNGLNHEGTMFCEFLYKCMEQSLSMSYAKEIIHTKNF